MSALTIQFYRGGVYFPALQLWLDPHEPQTGADRVFVSHAHSDHIGEHREVILSEPTARFMRARLGGHRLENVLPFGQPATFETSSLHWQITLLPAGHIFGSAMSLIEAEGESLLYTGDFKLRRGLSAEPCEPSRACGTDVLIMETTYGRPAYHFPPTDDVLNGVVRFCREAIDNDETPVLLGYSLGKSQELLRGLADAHLPVLLHKSVHEVTRIYEQLGQTFPPYGLFEGKAPTNHVLICPPMSNLPASLRKAGRVRTAVLTGWAVDPDCRFRYQTDAAFPLSDHADFPDLIEFVKRVAPGKVYTLHGFAADFAQTLREMGFDARALSEEEQLALPLVVEAATKRVSDRGRHARSGNGNGNLLSEFERGRSSESAAAEDSRGPAPRGEVHEKTWSFASFAETCAATGSVSSKLEKIRLLAEYLQTLEGEVLACVATWFTGYPFAPSRNKVLQTGWALIRDALCAIGQISAAEFHQIYLKHSDAGETAFEILSQQSRAVSGLSIAWVHELFERLLAARGPSGKLPALVEALGRGTALEGKFLVKILTGDLRIGLKEGLVEEAIAKAFGAPMGEVRRANLLLGDIGETVRLSQQAQLASASLAPFRPVKFMLASPEESAAAIWERMATEATEVAEPTHAGITVWLEDKYDGIRCQLHKVGERVALYSRDLKEITDTFRDIGDAARKLPGDLILDGEILAMRGEEVLPFAELQKRLGRRENDLFLNEEIPVRYIAFDLLWRDGGSFLDEPLRVRRRVLESLASEAIRLARITEAKSPEEIEAAFSAARARGNEGLMIKDPASFYSPGRRGLAWLKLKKAYATLDCVVVGAEYGHGKRKNVLSDYTFAVRNEAGGDLKTIGKAYSGLTDVEIAGLTQHFLSRTLRQHGRYHEVDPDTVLEIAFDSIRPSARHASGLAMRFPRIVRIRTDKSVAEIDTVATARKLVQR